MLLATPERLTTDNVISALLAAQGMPTVTADLGAATQIASYWAMGERGLRDYVGDGPLVTDNNAYFLPHADETDRIMATMQATVNR